MSVLNHEAKALFEPVAFGTLSTINRNGSPQVTLVSAFVDGDEIVLFHRGWYQKLRNIGRDPRVVLCVVPPPAGPGMAMLPYLVVHGTARVVEGDAQPWSDRLIALRDASLPPGTPPPPVMEMPANGGWTTRITPTRIGGLGPWMALPH